MRNLKSLCNQNLKNFFNSFDIVLSDLDGVLWNILEPIPGVGLALESLQKLNKQIIFVSNNSTTTLDDLHQLKDGNFDTKACQILNPALAIVSYLQKHYASRQDIFVLGLTPLKQALTSAGFSIAKNGPRIINESIKDYVSLCLIDNKNVGAVVVDIDPNINLIDLQMATTFLQRPEVLFLTGARDKRCPIGLNKFLIGPGYLLDILEDTSGRKAVQVAKPSPSLKEIIVEKFKIHDPSRVLFIGDSITEDMAFATNCGYKKLLVLSGLSNESCIDNWTHPEEYKPDFYVDNLKTVHEVIVQAFGASL